MVYSIYHKGCHVGYVNAQGDLPARQQAAKVLAKRWRKPVSVRSLLAVGRPYMSWATFLQAEHTDLHRPLVPQVIRGTTRNETDPLDGSVLYWHGKYGWVDLEGAERYYDKPDTLPIHGVLVYEEAA